MRKSLKTITAAALSAAMIFVPSMASFADEPAAATGNILAYDFDTVVVPTTIKFAINPQELDVTTSYTKVADTSGTPVAGTIYYTESNGVYTKASNLTAFATNTTYYTGNTVSDQIVSLNYGIASKATADKNVLVSFAIAGGADNTGDELKDISFVATKAEAEAKSETNASGADVGELKMYLELVPAKASTTVSANTYEKASGFVDNTTVYYTRDNSNVYSLAGTDGTFTDADAYKAVTDQLYVATTTIGAETLPSELSDVTMTVSDQAAAKCGFEAGTNSSKSAIAFKLGKAVYDLRAGEDINFSTTQGDIENKLEIKTMGASTGFTISGAMNPNADWTKAKVNTLVITPVYTIKDSTGADTEAALTNGGLEQISTTAFTPANAAPSIATTSYTLTADTAVNINVNLGSGTLAATSITTLKNGTQALPSDAWSYSNGVLTITAARVNSIVNAGVSRTYTVVFNDTAGTTVDITLDGTGA